MVAGIEHDFEVMPDSLRKTLRDYLLFEGVKGKRFWDNNNSLRIFEVQDVYIHRGLASLMVRYGHPSWFDNTEDEKGITPEVMLFDSYLNAPEYFKSDKKSPLDTD